MFQLSAAIQLNPEAQNVLKSQVTQLPKPKKLEPT